MARQDTARRHWWVIVAVVFVVLLAVFVLLGLFLSSGEAGEGATPQTSSTNPEPTPTITPGPMPASTEGLEEHVDDTPLLNEYDCQNFMSATEYTSFMERVYEFEVISQMQPSDQRLELLYPYVTEAFMNSQKGFFERPVVEGVSVEVSKDSGMACQMDSDNEILARITPTIAIVQQNDDGTTTVLNGPMTLPATHFTRWVQLEDIWYVNQEKK